MPSKTNEPRPDHTQPRPSAQRPDSTDLRTQVLVRAWKDADFREAVRRNPRKALREFGFNVPYDVDLNVLDDDPKTYHLILREPPCGSPSQIQRGDLTSDELLKASQGHICTITAECFCPNSVTGACTLFCPEYTADTGAQQP